MPFLKNTAKLTFRTKVIENGTRKSGLRHAIFTASGHKYVGEWFDDKRQGVYMEGNGSLLTATCNLYEGGWLEGFRHGYGILAFCKENKIFIYRYRGDWIRGKESGFGARWYPDGSYYLGNFKNGKLDGYGQMWYADGCFYDGDWRRDQRHGSGLWVRSDGNRYEGNWQYDLKHGKGRFFHLRTGQMQEGVWQKDICVYSTVIDIPYRQSAIQPTSFPIHNIELINVVDLCNEQELKAVAEKIRSCLRTSQLSILPIQKRRKRRNVNIIQPM